MSEWNISPSSPFAWCSKCKGPMLEGKCPKGDECKPDRGEYHAFELAMTMLPSSEEPK
jgi:hypothetical protein